MGLRKGVFLCITMISIATMPLYADTDLSAREIVERIDRLFRSNTSYGKVKMKIETPHWMRSLLMEVWTEGTDKTFIRVLSPKKDKNMATLKIGNKMWNYLPKVNKIIKIPPSMMMSSWMGSDFTNDDLVKEYTFVDDYNFKIIDFPGDSSKEMVYIECVPKEGVPIVWSKIIVAVRKKDYTPVWERFFDDRGEVVRVMKFSEIKVVSNRTIPTVIEMIPLKKEGHRTVLRYLEIKFDIPMDKSIFSLRNLRNVR